MAHKTANYMKQSIVYVVLISYRSMRTVCSRSRRDRSFDEGWTHPPSREAKVRPTTIDELDVGQ